MATMSFDYSKTSAGITIERYRGSEAVVDVPYNIAGLQVVKIGKRAFAGCKDILFINIPYCVTEIAVDAFAGCELLSEIRWNNTTIKLGGDSVKIFGRNDIQVPTFFAVSDDPEERDASKLVKTPVEEFDYSYITEGILIERYLGAAEIVVVPPKIKGVPVVRIGFDAFGDCRKLKELRLPESLQSINSRALDGCRNLSTVHVPESLRGKKVVDEIVAAVPEGCAVRYV